MRLCNGCGLIKDRFPLSNRKATRHGVKTYYKTHCTDCHSHQARILYQLRKIYTPPPQGTPCECCNRTPSKALLLDHDHVNGHFRGWLCQECNACLGFFGDDAAGITMAMQYLNA